MKRTVVLCLPSTDWRDANISRMQSASCDTSTMTLFPLYFVTVHWSYIHEITI